MAKEEPEEKVYPLNPEETVAIMTRWSAAPAVAYHGVVVAADNRGVKLALADTLAIVFLPWKNVDSALISNDRASLLAWCEQAAVTRAQARMDTIGNPAIEQEE